MNIRGLYTSMSDSELDQLKADTAVVARGSDGVDINITAIGYDQALGKVYMKLLQPACPAGGKSQVSDKVSAFIDEHAEKLSQRGRNVLRRLAISNAIELGKLEPKQLRKLKGCGKKTIDNVMKLKWEVLKCFKST